MLEATQRFGVPARWASTDCLALGIVPWQLNSPASWKGCRTSTHAMCRIDVPWCFPTNFVPSPIIIPCHFQIPAPRLPVKPFFFKLLNFQNTKKNLAWQSLSLATLRSSGVAITAMPNICHPSSRWTVTLAMEIYILRPLAFDHENGVLPC